jgi:hypothetical protein
MKCETCRYWSEMLAQAGGGRPGVRALCLSSESPLRQKWTSETQTCGSWKGGNPIDAPPGYRRKETT